MKIISFIENPTTIDKIIRHLKLTFDAERQSPKDFKRLLSIVRSG